jgi:hypothetical protein
MSLHTQNFPMLSVYIHPSYKGVSIRKVMLPRDAEDLIAIHTNSDYSPRSPYGAYLVSCYATTLFLLELMPIDHTDLAYYYEPVFFDYSIEIKLGIDSKRTEEAVQALSAVISGIFAENLEIYRLVSRVTDNAPESLLRTVLERAGFERLEGQVDMAEPVIYVRWRRRCDS